MKIMSDSFIIDKYNLNESMSYMLEKIIEQ
jgi:hypothetical protein